MELRNKKLLLGIIGLLCILLLLFNRLLRIRLPRDLNHISTEPVFYHFIYLTIILLTFLIIVNVFQLYKNLVNQGNPRIFSAYIALLLKKYNSVLEPIISTLKELAKSPKTFYDIFISSHFNVAHLVEIPLYKISRLFLYKSEFIKRLVFYTIYISFNTVPKIICLYAFLQDIITHQRFDQFYKTLLLLVIPLIYNAFVSIVIDLCDKNTYYATAHIDVVTIDEDQETIVFRKKLPPIEDVVDIIARHNDTGLLKWFAPIEILNGYFIIYNQLVSI